VAEAVAATLHDGGVAVDVRPARDVRNSLVGWDVVVVGAPIHSGRWHTDAHRFLKRHRGELRQMPVVVFGIGPRGGTEEAWRRCRSQLDRALAKRDRLAPAATTVFGGVDPPKRAEQARRDLRDWDAIRAWATDIPRLLPPAAPAAPAPSAGTGA